LSTVEIVAIRHGETTANALGKISGWHNVHLSDRGQQMARALKSILNHYQFDQIFSSDLQRAIDTARLAGYEPSTKSALRELDFGSVEGKIWQELPTSEQESILRFDEHCAPGGETISQLEARVIGFVDSLPPGRHALFVHGGVIRCLLRPVGADQFVPPTSIAHINWTNKTLLTLQLGPHD
jgi:2,3-bisphosphoglycerate-dependent phosphoglycerate mutase